MFPPSWNRKPISASVTPLGQDEEKRFYAVLEKSLKKYPPYFAAKYIKKIYLLKTMSFYQKKYGGTSAVTLKYLYLTNEGEEKGYTDQYLENAFHHEFHHLIQNLEPSLFQRYQTLWRKINPKKFKYGQGGKDALGTTLASLLWEKKYQKQGFLTPYSTSHINEDFAVLTASLFSETKKLLKTAENHPLLQKKITLLIHFYGELHPDFTEAYFKNLDIERDL